MGSLLVRSRILTGVVIAAFALASAVLLISTSKAAQLSGDFALELSPSPIVATIKPGAETNIPLKIHNIGIHAENLKIELKEFSIDQKTGVIDVSQQPPAEVDKWVTFDQPTFTAQVGQWVTDNIKISLPKESGFSYSFAVVVSRASENQTSSGRQLQGSVADFTLVNVDKPGASSKIDVTNFSTDQQIYEFLPTKINVAFKNVGNTITQPQGNIFILRNASDTKPLATMPVNQNQGYVLPGVQRSFIASWSDGFPVFKTTTTADGSSSTGLSFNWDNLSNFRIGKYTAKLVAYYNDGQRDVPIERDVTFWVIPYKTIAAIVIILIILLLVRRRFVERKTNKAVKKALATRDKQPKKSS
jgi:hypothetical protein